jgi:hypothetical protein
LNSRPARKIRTGTSPLPGVCRMGSRLGVGGGEWPSAAAAGARRTAAGALGGIGRRGWRLRPPQRLRQAVFKSREFGVGKTLGFKMEPLGLLAAEHAGVDRRDGGQLALETGDAGIIMRRDQTVEGIARGAKGFGKGERRVNMQAQPFSPVGLVTGVARRRKFVQQPRFNGIEPLERQMQGIGFRIEPCKSIIGRIVEKNPFLRDGQQEDAAARDPRGRAHRGSSRFVEALVTESRDGPRRRP